MTMSDAHRGAMSASVQLVFPGAPRTKKNSGDFWMVGTKKVLRPSPYWMAWRDGVKKWWLELPAVARRQRITDTTLTINCTAFFYRDARRGDAVGYYQGLADVLQELEIIPDDKQIVSWDGSRLFVDSARPRVELWLTPVQ